MKHLFAQWLLTTCVAVGLMCSTWAQEAFSWPTDSTYTVLKTKAGSSGDPAVQNASTFVLYTSGVNVGSPCTLGADYDYRFGTGSYTGTWPTGTLTVKNNLQMVWNANITGGAKSIYFTSGRWNISDGARLAGKVSGPIYVKGAQFWPTINAHTYANDFYFGTPTYTGDSNTGYRSALRVSMDMTFNGVVTAVEDTSFTADGKTATFKDFRLNANLELKKPNANGTFVFTKLTPTGARTINNAVGAIVKIGTYVVPATADVLTINNWTAPTTTPVTIEAATVPAVPQEILKVTTGTLAISQFTAPAGAVLFVSADGKTLSIGAPSFTHTATISAPTAWESIAWDQSEPLTTASAVQITVENNATISFDAAAPVSVAMLSVDGAATFKATGTLAGGEGLTFSTPVLTTLMMGTIPSVTSDATLEGYTLTPAISATGLTLNGVQANLRVMSVSVIGGHTNRAGASVSGEGFAGVIPVKASLWNNILNQQGSPFTTSFTSFKEVNLSEPDASIDRIMGSTFQAQCTYSDAGATANADAQLAFGYLDDGATNGSTEKGATITLENVPYTEYAVIVYFGSEGDGSFGPVCVNDQWYTWSNNALAPIASPTQAWGSRAASRSDSVTWVEGTNYLKFEGLTASTCTISGAKIDKPTSGTRCGIAGIQIVCTGVAATPTTFTAAAESDVSMWQDLMWDSDDNTYENGPANTAIINFNLEGTESYSFDMNNGSETDPIVAKQVTFTATAPLTVENSNETEGGSLAGIGTFDFSGTGDADVWLGTGASTIIAGTHTVLENSGSGPLMVGEEKKATLKSEWTGSVVNSGTVAREFAVSSLEAPGGSYDAINEYIAGSTGAVALPETEYMGTIKLSGGTFTLSKMPAPANNAALTIAGDASVSFAATGTGYDSGINLGAALFTMTGGTITAPRFTMSSNGAATIEQSGGEIVITGEVSEDSNNASVLFTASNNRSTYTMTGGIFNATNCYALLDKGGNAMNWTIGAGATEAVAKLKGVKLSAAAKSPRPLTISTNGRLEVGELGIDYGGKEVNGTAANLAIYGGTLAATESFTTDVPVAIYEAATIEVPADKELSMTGVIAPYASANIPLRKSGAGVLRLSGNNTYKVKTAIDQGTVIAENATALGTGFIQMEGGTKLVLANPAIVSTSATFKILKLEASATAANKAVIEVAVNAIPGPADPAIKVVELDDGTTLEQLSVIAVNAEGVPLDPTSYKVRVLGSDVEIMANVVSQTWTGAGAEANWSLASNWENAVVPAGIVPVLFFDGTSKIVNTNDIDGLTIESLQLIGGGPFLLRGKAATVKSITSGLSAAQGILFPIQNGAEALTTSGTGPLTFTAGITAGASTFDGPVTLHGSNAFSGTTTVNAKATLSGTTTVTGDFGGGETVGTGNLLNSTADGITFKTGSQTTITGTLMSNGSAVTATSVYTGNPLFVEAGATVTANRVFAHSGMQAAKSDTISGNLTVATDYEFFFNYATRVNTTINLGGTLQADRLLLRKGASAILNGTGGSLILGSGGIAVVDNIENGETLTFTLDGVRLGATADWSVTAPRTYVIANTVTFNTVDTENVPHTITFGKAIGGSGAIAKTGAGTLVLGAANTYQGSTTVNAGTLKLLQGATFGQGDIIFAGGTTLDVSAVTNAVAVGDYFTVAAGDTVSIDVTNRTLTAGEILLSWGYTPEGDFTLTGGAAGYGVEKTDTGLKVTSATPEAPTVDAPAGTPTAVIDEIKAAALAAGIPTTATITVSADNATKLNLFDVTPTFTGTGDTRAVADITVEFTVTAISFDQVTGLPTVTATITDGNGVTISTTTAAKVVVKGGASLDATTWTTVDTITDAGSSFNAEAGDATPKFFKFTVEAK